MKYLILLSLLACGCAHTADIDVSGDNLDTPYGKIEHGHITVHTTWGKYNAVDSRPTTNTTK